jgi:hypothetical protein
LHMLIMVYDLFSFIFLLLCWVEVHCGIYKSSYNISNISYFNHPLHYFPLLPPPPIPGTVSTGLIFLFTYMYTQYLHRINPPAPFPHFLLPPTGTNLPRQDLFCPPVLQFCKRNIKITCLYKISTQGVSSLYFHVYMYYSPNWFISSIFIFLSSLHMVVSIGLKILFIIAESTLTIFTFLTSFFLMCY